jgi:hypothetical protein
MSSQQGMICEGLVPGLRSCSFSFPLLDLEVPLPADQGLVDNAVIGNLDLPHRDPIAALVQQRLSEIGVSFEVLGKSMER